MESSLYSPTRPVGSNELPDRAFETGLTHERKRLGATHLLHINGRARRSTAAMIQDLNPADTRMVIGRFQQARPDHVRKAIQAARKAFPFWRELGWEQRTAFVRKVAELLDKHAHEFAALLCLEAGHPRRRAMAEVQHTIQSLLGQCQQLELQQGFRTSLAANGSMRAYDTLEPRGVWGILSSAESPLLTSAALMCAAVLTGNTVVFKPSSQAPFIALRFHDLFNQAGFPVGIINFITGPGEATGQHLALHSELDGLAFAGTQAVGMRIRQGFNERQQRPCLLHMSASNPVLVMPTAPLEEAAQAIVEQTFSSAGQGVDAWSRVYVHRSVSREFNECLADLVASLRVGMPEATDTHVGPLAKGEAVVAYRQVVKQARKDGRVVCGGNELRAGELAHGHFVEPTLVSDVSRDSDLHSEPMALPILLVTEVRSLEDAVQLANRSPYGVAAGLYSQVDGEQQCFFDEMEAGTLICNRRSATSSVLPASGGWKESSSTGKHMAGPHFLPQFMREQARHLYW